MAARKAVSWKHRGSDLGGMQGELGGVGEPAGGLGAPAEPQPSVADATDTVVSNDNATNTVLTPARFMQCATECVHC